MSLLELKKIALKQLEQRYPTFPKHAIPQPNYTDRTSNGLTKCIVDWIEFNGFQAERINSTGRQIDKRKEIKDSLGNCRTIGSVKWVKGSTQVGTADISATIKGRSVKIEVKCKVTKDNYQSKGQKEYQRKIEKAGGVYIIARTFKGFYEWYLQFLKQ